MREFRDGYLLSNAVGQAFVDLYYRTSPPIAEFIAEHPVLKPIVRVGLVPAVIISAVAVNTTPSQKMAIAALLSLALAVPAAWAIRQQSKPPQNIWE